MTSTADKALRADESTVERMEHSEIPTDFLEWQRSARTSLFRTVVTGGSESVKSMPCHLAVLGSLRPDGTINLATKGVGLVPKEERIADFTGSFRAALKDANGASWESSLERRMKTLLMFYGEIDNFDNTKLGGLEIFEGATYANLRNEPRASLLFTDGPPAFRSYEIEGTVEFVDPGSPHFEFLLAARELFARDSFHVPQNAYPHGFVFHVSKVRDKRPFTRRR